jgi:CubicO group peptidase (beta-lactamase class C family)
MALRRVGLRRVGFGRVLTVAIVLSAGAWSYGEDSLPADLRETIDKAVPQILKQTGAPGASLAVVKDGKVAYTHAYGLAQLEPRRDATTEMRYAIGSVSKQFTATAVLLLAEEGTLSLDDKVAKWLPALTRADEVTIRQLLSMTAGYQDYWPQDYVFPKMLDPVRPMQVLDEWARKPLDFEPGTRWQYSNTNYVAAGLIVEKASGMGLVEFLHKRVFDPLHMTSVFDTDRSALPKEDPEGYLRYALGPLRPAPKEGPGWIYAAGELAMTARDLALWDISMIDQTVLKPASYGIMQSEMHLTDGAGTRYGLGVQVLSTDGHRTVMHSGEVSGFSARNAVYPDDRAAVVVLSNLDATSATGDIAARITPMLLKPATTARAAERPPAEAIDQAKQIFESLQKGRIDRSLFSSNANAYFTDEAVKDFAASLGPLGTPRSFTGDSQLLRGGMTLRHYTIRFEKKTVRAWTFTLSDGKLEQYMVAEE